MNAKSERVYSFRTAAVLDLFQNESFLKFAKIIEWEQSPQGSFHTGKFLNGLEALVLALDIGRHCSPQRGVAFRNSRVPCTTFQSFVSWS